MRHRLLPALPQSPAIWERYKLALGIPHIGHKTARVIVCELPENLCAYAAKQLAAYFGAAPRDRASGKRNWGARVPKSGNQRLKKGLHMAAQLSLRREPELAELYARLKAKGRHHLAALTAVKHKLAARVIAILKRGTPWLENAPRVDIC